MKEIKSVLFTHDDLDGAGCHIVFSLAMWQRMVLNYGKSKSTINGDDFLIIHCSNANIDDQVKWAIAEYVLDYRTTIYFADIVPSRDILDWIQPMFPELYIFDHHRTNFFAQHIIPSAVIIPENDIGIPESGTSLLYKHFCSISPFDPEIINEPLLDTLVDKIRSYDTWEWKDKGDLIPKKLQVLLYLLGMKRFCLAYTLPLRTDLKRTELFTPDQCSFIDARLENEQNIIDDILKRYNASPEKSILTPLEVHGYKAVLNITQTGANVSELASRFLEEHPEIDVYIGFSLYGNGELSFRTKKPDIDLGAVFAQPLGGGGHPAAAGASVNDRIRCNLLEMLTSYIKGGEDMHLEAHNTEEVPAPIARIIPWYMNLIEDDEAREFFETHSSPLMKLEMRNKIINNYPVISIELPAGGQIEIDQNVMLTAWSLFGSMPDDEARRCWKLYTLTIDNNSFYTIMHRVIFYIQVTLYGPLPIGQQITVGVKPTSTGMVEIFTPWDNRKWTVYQDSLNEIYEEFHNMSVLDAYNLYRAQRGYDKTSTDTETHSGE